MAPTPPPTIPNLVCEEFSHDYVVVGAGAGGSAAAGYLSSLGVSTMLLDAGTDEAVTNLATVPLYQTVW